MTRSNQIKAFCVIGGTSTKVVVLFLNEETKIEKAEFYSLKTTEPHTLNRKIKEVLKNSTVGLAGVATFGPLEWIKGQGLVKSKTKNGFLNFYTEKLFGNLRVVLHDCQASAIAAKLYFPQELIFKKLDQDDWTLTRQTKNNFEFYKCLFAKRAGLNQLSVIYITVGTGVGVAYVDKHGNFGFPHSLEFGHSFVGKLENDCFAGNCGLHGSCVEGLISAPAIAQRLAIAENELKDVCENHPVWELCAKYLALFVVNCHYMFKPDKIVLGGGVLNRKTLFDRCLEETDKLDRHDYLCVGKKLSKLISLNRYGTEQEMLGLIYTVVNNYN